jgi:hypothetical protein
MGTELERIITSCINKSSSYFPFLILLVTEKVNTSSMQGYSAIS